MVQKNELKTKTGEVLKTTAGEIMYDLRLDAGD